MKPRTIQSIVIIVTGIAALACLSCRETTGSKIAAPAGLGKEQNIISLSGSWLFRLDRDKVGEQEKWYNGTLTGRIRLPGSTAENGYGDEVSVDTEWTGQIVDRSWFTEARYEKYR